MSLFNILYGMNIGNLNNTARQRNGVDPHADRLKGTEK